MASVPLGFLGDYHRSSANLKVSGDVTEMTFQKVSQKLPIVSSPASPPRVQGDNEKLQTFSYFSSQFSFVRSSGVGCMLPVTSYILQLFILPGVF